MNRSFRILAAGLLTVVVDHATAGMPSALPEDFAQVLRLDESIEHRLQSISFFGFVFVLATFAFWTLWNNLARSFSMLPPLPLTRAACLTLLLGSLFVVVLTMISGARELLTPGAWQKQGVTYTVTPPDASYEAPDEIVSSRIGHTQAPP